MFEIACREAQEMDVNQIGSYPEASLGKIKLRILGVMKKNAKVMMIDMMNP
jgi:hypothetical protein